MSKAEFEPITLVKLEETRSISSKRSWVVKLGVMDILILFIYAQYVFGQIRTQFLFYIFWQFFILYLYTCTIQSRNNAAFIIQ